MTETRTFDLVDEALRSWRQGDCYLGDCWFLFRSDIECPMTPESVEAAAEGIDSVEVEVRGFLLASQTCDIVRKSSERPFVEVCPLVEVGERTMNEVRSARRPQYAHVPGLEAHNLVADLDRTMIVEKAVVAGRDRIEGCSSDSAVRQLSSALARKRSRVAFPDDFVPLAAGLEVHAKAKYKKDSPAGRALQALREIRVRADPNWSAPRVALTFLFISDEDIPPPEGGDWTKPLTKWLELLYPAGRFITVDAQVLSLDDLTAREYIESDPLDLEHLSAGTRRESTEMG